MPGLPLISVALCTYNGARFLPAQLDSLLAQDYPELEVVAFDDASSDGTFEVLQGCAARDPRLRVHRNPANLGFRRNFEGALRACRGELIAPCDQDDVWRPDKLRRMERALGVRAAVFCDSLLVDERGEPLGRLSGRIPMRDFEDPAQFLFGNRVSGHALLVRREVVERAAPFPERLFHDWWLAFVAAGAGGIGYLDEPLVQYRQHPGAVTDTVGARQPGGPRFPGYARIRAEGVEERLRAFAAFPGEAQELFVELLGLWEGWKRQLLSPRLALFLLHHRQRFFVFRQREPSRRVTGALDYLWGLRARRLVRPQAYGS